jgi:hypothetical protein
MSGQVCTSAERPPSIGNARGTQFGTGNPHTNWSVAIHSVSMGELLLLGAYPNGVLWGQAGVRRAQLFGEVATGNEQRMIKRLIAFGLCLSVVSALMAQEAGQSMLFLRQTAPSPADVVHWPFVTGIPTQGHSPV